MADRKQLVTELHQSFGSVKRCLAFKHLHDDHDNLNRAQLEVLFYLNCKPGQTASVKEIRHITQTTHSAVTQLVETLERHGYVERRHSPEDRRVVLVHFTGRARDKLNKIHQNMTGMLLKLTEHLSDQELKTLVDIHKKIAMRVNEL